MLERCLSVPGDNGSSISSSCTTPIADASLAVLLPTQSMLVLLKLGAPMNRLPPE
jgi:hypothetical protein